MEEKIVIITTIKQLELRGLIKCKCGHPNNNHFDFDNCPCSQCDCKKYEPTLIQGFSDITAKITIKE